MKLLALFALSAFATAAMAASPTTVNEIKIDGTSNQTASVTGQSIVLNLSTAGTYANQNLASNKGKVEIKKNAQSDQTATVTNGLVVNAALAAGDVAVQSLASNVGNVEIGGKSTQKATVNGAMINIAAGDGCGTDCDPKKPAVAYQNASTNMGKVTVASCATSTQTTTVNGTMVNAAVGEGALAVQNAASNYGHVTITGHSTQNYTVGSGSLVANLAWGKNSTAYQNLASNDSCEPPGPICRGAECGPFASN